MRSIILKKQNSPVGLFFFVILFEVIKMKEVLEFLKHNKIMILSAILVLILGTGYFLNHKQPNKSMASEPKIEHEEPIKRVTKSEKLESKSTKCVVDVEGAVQKPGVYRVKNGAIVQEVLNLAGGLKSNADTKQLNRAKKVTDQMQLYVPLLGEQNPIVSSNGSDKKSNQPVNINTATVDDFKNVTGIGPKKAEKIIAFREKNGNFKELHDLTKVSGIGEKSLDSLKDQLTV